MRTLLKMMPFPPVEFIPLYEVRGIQIDLFIGIGWKAAILEADLTFSLLSGEVVVRWHGNWQGANIRLFFPFYLFLSYFDVNLHRLPCLFHLFFLYSLIFTQIYIPSWLQRHLFSAYWVQFFFSFFSLFVNYRL